MNQESSTPDRTCVAMVVVLGLLSALPAIAGCSVFDRNKAYAKAILQARCTRCHSLDRVDRARYDLAGWKGTIDRMISHGAKLTDKEKGALADHLANR